MRSLALGMVLLISTAAMAAPAKKPVPRRRTALPQVSVAAKKKAAEAVAAWLDAQPTLENARALVPFFEQLYRREKGLSEGPARILHYGDSHTAADEWTGTIRHLLQMRFGNGGAGFSLAGRPFFGYRRLDVKSTSTRGWLADGVAGRETDGLGGLGGISIRTSRPRETVVLEADCERAELYFLRQPGGGEVDISDNGAPARRISTGGEREPAAEMVSEIAGTHRFQLTTVTRAPVRLFGWVTENSRGVTYESLGINSAEASILLNWDAALFEQYMARRSPALVVLAYGTNEAGHRDWTRESYEGMFARVLARVRRAAPEASILVVGPPDRYYRLRGKWTVHPGVDRIVEAQRAAALAAGCAFWDLRARMGGPGVMRQWVLAGLAHYDYVHFAAPGYRLLGGALYKELMDVYATFTRLREEQIPAGDNGSVANGQSRTHHSNHP